MNKSNFSKYIWVIATFVLGSVVVLGFMNYTSSEPASPEAMQTTNWSPNGADPCLGEITIFAGTYAPRGWAFCHGQLLPISQNDALFSILGTIYGGDGRTTFGLPDLQGRVPIHAGNGPGLSPRRLGSKGGEEIVTAAVASTVGQAGSGSTITGIQSASQTAPANGQYYNWMPSLAINYIIATTGVYCSRN